MVLRLGILFFLCLVGETEEVAGNEVFPFFLVFSLADHFSIQKSPLVFIRRVLAKEHPRRLDWTDRQMDRHEQGFVVVMILACLLIWLICIYQLSFWWEVPRRKRWVQPATHHMLPLNVVTASILLIRSIDPYCVLGRYRVWFCFVLLPYLILATITSTFLLYLCIQANVLAKILKHRNPRDSFANRGVTRLNRVALGVSLLLVFNAILCTMFYAFKDGKNQVPMEIYYDVTLLLVVIVSYTLYVRSAQFLWRELEASAGAEAQWNSAPGISQALKKGKRVMLYCSVLMLSCFGLVTYSIVDNVLIMLELKPPSLENDPSTGFADWHFIPYAITFLSLVVSIFVAWRPAKEGCCRRWPCVGRAAEPDNATRHTVRVSLIAVTWSLYQRRRSTHTTVDQRRRSTQSSALDERRRSTQASCIHVMDSTMGNNSDMNGKPQTGPLTNGKAAHTPSPAAPASPLVNLTTPAPPPVPTSPPPPLPALVPPPRAPTEAAASSQLPQPGEDHTDESPPRLPPATSFTTLADQPSPDTLPTVPSFITHNTPSPEKNKAAQTPTKARTFSPPPSLLVNPETSKQEQPRIPTPQSGIVRYQEALQMFAREPPTAEVMRAKSDVWPASSVQLHQKKKPGGSQRHLSRSAGTDTSLRRFKDNTPTPTAPANSPFNIKPQDNTPTPTAPANSLFKIKTPPANTPPSKISRSSSPKRLRVYQSGSQAAHQSLQVESSFSPAGTSSLQASAKSTPNSLVAPLPTPFLSPQVSRSTSEPAPSDSLALSPAESAGASTNSLVLTPGSRLVYSSPSPLPFPAPPPLAKMATSRLDEMLRSNDSPSPSSPPRPERTSSLNRSIDR